MNNFLIVRFLHLSNRAYTNQTLNYCQFLTIVAFFLGAGSLLGLPTFVIVLFSFCMNVGVGWFLLASVFACLAAAQSGTTAYYLLNWREFWDEIIEEVRNELDNELDQEDVDRIYKNFEDYEFLGYIAIGVAVLWLLCALLLCFFAGSYKRALREATQLPATTQGTTERQEQPRETSPKDTATWASTYDTDESLA